MRKVQKLLVLIILGIFALASVSISVNAYYWWCGGNGDKLPEQTWFCSSTCCRVCLSDSGWAAAPYRCNGITPCGCGSSTDDDNLDISPPDLVVATASRC